MMRLSLLSMAAVMVAAVSAPAQITVDAKLGRSIRGAVTVGSPAHHGHGHHDRRDHRGHDHRHDHRGRHEPIRRAPAPHHGHHGHWRTVEEQVLVPGFWRDEHVPPTYGWIHDSCGHRRWGIVDAGGCRRVWVPARWETRCRKVWVPC
jgi:hypothetical protein